MPRYDYICNNKKCETKVFEAILNFSDDIKVRCPDCNRLTKKRKDFYPFSFSM